ncbi:YcaO-like family protein [Nonomuraea jiangxiensis]|uniref:Ribosomal protein S12 methylthiotransferase accessory factor n=1 Tax=Nonomuraea jiangxiensis TaxID=633440 RepID=A0A1G9EST3_9ACTN|nr:YcaO-like family protein [Nonomuraea jiangxiensis]SDK79065.1 ribosomal protein S12 methylthiotransferase accessory factor [Nonomuraea jiangxiensis]
MPVGEADRRAAAALAALGLRAELADVGAGRDPTAWWCELLDGDAGPAACGMGKGRPAEARVGALFEAVEHYLTGPARFDPAAVEPAPPAAIAAGPLRTDATALLLARMPGRRMACLRYRPLGGGREALVPLFLFAPWYVEAGAARLRERAGDDCDYTHLMRYSCNSGSAAGVTAAEALLHALNEVIERDALSLLLVRAFLGAEGFRPTLIDPATLPPGPARAYATAGELTGAPVHLLDITSDVGVPTMLAYTAPTAGRPHRRGTGTSLDPSYAAWRALTELVQATLGESGSMPRPAAPAHADLAGLAAHPALHACGRFDLTGPLRTARVAPFPRAAATAGPPGGQVRKVTAMLAARGCTAYHRTAGVLPRGVTAVHVVVPELERFMLVTDGNLVLPGRRGLAAAAGKISATMPSN